MSPLRRLGDLVKYSGDESKGDRRTLPGTIPLASKIFFPNHLDIPEYYIYSTPLMTPSNFHLPDNIPAIGEYEASLITTLLDPTLPLICVEGALGSGKSTTIQFVIRSILQEIDCGHCFEINQKSCQRMIVWIDCKNFTDSLENEPHNGKLVRHLCTQLNARSRPFITDDKEFIYFWNNILDEFDLTCDFITSNVAGELINIS